MRLIFNRVNRAINYVNINRTLIAVFTHIYSLYRASLNNAVERWCDDTWSSRRGDNDVVMP